MSLVSPALAGRFFTIQFSSVQWLSHVRLFVAPWTVARQAPLSAVFSRQEYWSGLPFPTSGDLPDPGVESTPLALAGGFFTTSATRLPKSQSCFEVQTENPLWEATPT